MTGQPVPPHDDEQDAEHRAFRVPRKSVLPDVEQTEILQGAKPGSRYARRVREGERRFAPVGSEGAALRATDRATAPRSGSERFMRSVRKVLLGAPIASEDAEEQRRRGLRHPRGRSEQAEPVGVVVRAEDRERQRAARNRDDAVAGAMEDREQAR